MQPQISLVSKYLSILALVVGVFEVLAGFKRPQGLDYNNVNPTTHTVTIYRMKFNPAHLEVKKGDTVVWVNKGLVPHDVTEETSQKWTSEPFDPGEKWSMVVNEDIQYFCNLHKVMKGTISISK